MAAVISTLLDVARDGAVRAAADLLGRRRGAGLRAAGVPGWSRTTGFDGPHRGPGRLVVRAVPPVVDNAARHARGGVELGRRPARPRRAGRVDDGEGVDAVRGDAFDPGVTSGEGGAGLGLGIARRVARSFGGDIERGHRPATLRRCCRGADRDALFFFFFFFFF